MTPLSAADHALTKRMFLTFFDPSTFSSDPASEESEDELADGKRENSGGQYALPTQLDVHYYRQLDHPQQNLLRGDTPLGFKLLLEFSPTGAIHFWRAKR